MNVKGSPSSSVLRWKGYGRRACFGFSAAEEQGMGGVEPDMIELFAVLRRKPFSKSSVNKTCQQG
jgi:hypothetical protein